MSVPFISPTLCSGLLIIILIRSILKSFLPSNLCAWYTKYSRLISLIIVYQAIGTNNKFLFFGGKANDNSWYVNVGVILQVNSWSRQCLRYVAVGAPLSRDCSDNHDANYYLINNKQRYEYHVFLLSRKFYNSNLPIKI